MFFFDEAHLLFNDASKAFLDAVTQTVRLIRSKGVGVFFVTQTPKDVPADVLAQLGNRVQHALRAYTPDDAKALQGDRVDVPEVRLRPRGGAHPRSASARRSSRCCPRPGRPTPVAWTRLRAPQSLMAPARRDALAAAVGASPLQAEYGQALDRESAYERLLAKLAPPPAPAAPEQATGQARAPEPAQPEAQRRAEREDPP